MSRRAHIKRAKLLRDIICSSDMSTWSLSYGPAWRTINRRTRKCAQMAQAMRGYYRR